MFHISQTTHIATSVLCDLYKFILDLLKTYNKCYSALLESLNMLLHSRVVYFFQGEEKQLGAFLTRDCNFKPLYGSCDKIKL